MTENTHPDWWAKGLLFENCSCQLVCPAHVSFKQSCTHERCVGYWAIRFEEGVYGEVPLAGVMAAVFYDTPQRMYDGGWSEMLYLDARATPEQRAAVEAILNGTAGGPWAVLARFVSDWRDSRTVEFDFDDQGRKKSLSVAGLFETTIEAIKGPDPGRPAVLQNLYNTIHGFTHVLARGATKCSEKSFPISIGGTHALYSDFSWKGP